MFFARAEAIGGGWKCNWNFLGSRKDEKSGF
jgi:hypothetical protein